VKRKGALRTRKGLDWSARFPEIAADGRKLPDCIVDGEACALDAKGLPDFAALQAALSAGKTGGLVFFVFDLLFLDGFDLRNEPLAKRKDMLRQLIEDGHALAHYRYVEHFATSGKTMLETACQAGLEGIISKRIDAPYRSGRNELWTKAKCRGGQEVVIGGWWGDKDTLRSIQVGTFRDGGFAYMGSVGTGFNSRNVPPLLKALRGVTRKDSPFTVGVKPPRAKQINWVDPKLVAEVEYASLTTDGLLRQASFKALREDKPATSVVTERPVPAKQAERMAEQEKDEPMPSRSRTAAAPARIAAKNGDPSVAGVTITNASKILWPASGGKKEVTKLDLARYYEMAAERILPHIAGRPISLVRAPDGIEGQRFFQRHVLPGIPAVPIHVKGEAKPFHSVDDLKGLVALAQAGVLEFHPWGCRPNDPETPERLIFDLDPDEGLDFARVMGAAKDLRVRLESLGFTPFIKTTGGKGLHVVVAIKGTPKKQPTWPEAKEFARLFCESIAADDPDHYTTNMAKKKRGGKTFLDYLRNDRTATAVGAWSPRARDGATISLPITWSQVKTGLNPKDYSIHVAAKLLKRPDPWKDLMKTAIPLDAARKKLGR
jgi:bifunctional non-homologous end joining protein LigD